MHKIANATSAGSVGDLGRLASRLAESDINIEAIGGGEGVARGGSVGHISLLVTPDDNLTSDDIRALLENIDHGGGRRFESVEIWDCLDIELDDQPGELAVLATALGDAGIDIKGIVSVDVHAKWAIVAMGFEDVDAARAVIEAEVDNQGDPRWPILPKHGGLDRRHKVDREPGNRFKKGDR